MKKTNPSKQKDAPVPDMAPGGFSKDVSKKYFESGAEKTIERNKWFLIALIEGATIFGMVMAFNVLLPLKTIETYQVTKAEGGRLVADGTPVGTWAPDSDAISYFLGQWVNNVFDINPSTIRQTLAESTDLVIGNASAQLRELRQRDNPYALLKDDPQLFRSYEFSTINFVKDDVAFMRFKTITRSPDKPAKETYYAMTITFTRVKPKTKQQVMRNPAGLYISNFNLTEEAAPK